MDIRLLLVEDQGFRSEEFRRQAVTVSEAHPATPIVVDTMHSVYDVGEMEPQTLATYDAVLVDFHLATERLEHERGRESLPHTRIASACTGDRMVRVETGMGVLLHLTNEARTPEYVQARRHVTAGYPKRLQAPRLMTFGLLSEGWPSFFALAGRAWFGTTHVDANWKSNVAEISRMRTEILDGVPVLLADSIMNRRITASLSSFLAMMDSPVPRGRTKWVDPEKVGREPFDWYAMYLAAGGKAGAAQGVRNQIQQRWGEESRLENLSTQYAAQIAIPLQQNLVAFLNSMELGDTNRDWGAAEWLVGAPDEMLAVLTNSSVFWQSEDVRAALVEHRCQTRMPLPPAPVTRRREVLG